MSKKESSVSVKEVAEKVVENSAKKVPVVDRLPLQGINALKNEEKILRNVIRAIYQIKYARVPDLQPGIRKFTELFFNALSLLEVRVLSELKMTKQKPPIKGGLVWSSL